MGRASSCFLARRPRASFVVFPSRTVSGQHSLELVRPRLPLSPVVAHTGDLARDLERNLALELWDFPRGAFVGEGPHAR